MQDHFFVLLNLAAFIRAIPFIVTFPSRAREVLVKQIIQSVLPFKLFLSHYLFYALLTVYPCIIL